MGDSDDDVYVRGREEEWNYKDELLASCSYLGKKLDGNNYEKGIDCIESLKEIQQFLYRDDPVGEIDQPSRFDNNGRPLSKRPWELHRSLADWNILSNHILPLVACHGDDPEVLYESMVVMLLMTSLPPPPKYHLDDEKETRTMKHRVYGAGLVPVFDGLCIMKEQFAASKNVLLTIMKWLSEPLMHEGEDRTEAEATVLELALNLLRNLLQFQCPVDSGVSLPEITRRDVARAQDKLLQTLAEVGMLEMLIILAQRIEDEENRTWNLLLLDIFTLIFVKEDPAQLIGSAAVQRGAWQTSSRRQELLQRLPDPVVNASHRNHTGRRHQRFTGIYQTTANNGIKNVGGSMTASASSSVPSTKKRAGGFRKKPLLEANNHSIVDRTQVLETLDKFAKLFVEVGFNPLFGTVAFDYAMESNAIVKTDDWNYSALASWFLRYHRLREQGRIVALGPRPKEPEATKQPGDKHDDRTNADLEANADVGASDKTASDGTHALLATVAERLAQAKGDVRDPSDGGETQQEQLVHEPESVPSLTELGASEPVPSTVPLSTDLGVGESVEAEVSAVVETLCEQVSLSDPERSADDEVRAVLESLCAKVASASDSAEIPNQADKAGEQGDAAQTGDKDEDKTPDVPTPPPEPLDPYDYDAGQVSSLIDLGSLKWTLEKVYKMVKPETGQKAQFDQLPPLITLLREMVLALHSLFHSHTTRNKDVASVILRNLIFEWDCSEIFLTLLKEYRPDRNNRSYLADLCGLVHTSLRLIKSFSQENQNLVRLKRRRRKIGRNRNSVNKNEGDGEWLGGEDEYEEEEQYDEVVFHYDSFQRRFCHPQVVTTYVYLLSWYHFNSAETNHQVVKMLNLVGHSCNMLPMLFQLSIFRVFSVILSDASLEGKPDSKEMVDFVRWVVRNFFKLAMDSPCMFVEMVAWTKQQRDAALIMRGYKPEERAGKKEKGGTEEEVLYQLGKQAGKWTSDDDLLLTEAFHQYGGKPNAPQIIATMLEGKSAQQIAARLNKLGLSQIDVNGRDWSDEDEDVEDGSGPDVYTCARRLRNSRPAALDWVVEQLRLARIERDVLLTADRSYSDLPDEFFKMQPFSLVPIEPAEWDHVIDAGTMRLFNALGLTCPRLVEGHAYWTVGTALLEDTTGLDKKMSDLELAQQVPVSEPLPPPPPAARQARAGTPSGQEEEGEAAPASSQPTRLKKRRVRSNDEGDSDASAGTKAGKYGAYDLSKQSDDETDAEVDRELVVSEGKSGPAGEEEEEVPQTMRRKKTRRLLMDGDSDEEEHQASGDDKMATEGGGVKDASDVMRTEAVSKRARARLIQDSDSE